MLNNPIILGAKLPTLTNPGAAGDLLAGKQLIDQNGNVLTGTMVVKEPNQNTSSEHPNTLTAAKALYSPNTNLLTAGMIYFCTGFPEAYEPPPVSIGSSSSVRGYPITRGVKYFYEAVLYHRMYHEEPQWGYLFANAFSYDSSGNLKWESIGAGYPASDTNDIKFALTENGTLSFELASGFQFLLSTILPLNSVIMWYSFWQ